MKSKILMLISLCLLTVGTALGQTITVKGVVTDERGDGVIGATVRLKSDATVGTMTGMDGDFTLKAKQGEIIIVSYVGYKTQEVAAAPKLTIKLHPDTELLDDVIVVAYGTTKKESLTGAVSTVDSKTLTKRITTSATAALEGTASGVQVNNSYGEPGAAPVIRIRGIGTLGTASPLYVVDGVPFDGKMSELNANDIESFSILKDAASTALYGNRAANGVVLITTKSGKTGKPAVNVSINQGIYQRGIKEYERLDPKGWMEASWIAMRNYALVNNPGLPKGVQMTKEQANAYASSHLVADYVKNNIFDKAGNELFDANGNFLANIKPGYTDLDWMKALERTGHRQDYNISANYNNEKMNVYASVGYLDEKGYFNGSDYKRFSGRINSMFSPVTWFETGINLNVVTSDRNRNSDASGNAFKNPFSTARYMAPVYPVYRHNDDGSIMTDENGEKMYDTTSSYLSNRHIAFELLNDVDNSKRNVLGIQTYGTFKLPYGISFTIKGDLNKSNTNSLAYGNRFIGDGSSSGGRLNESAYQYTTYTFQQLLNWNYTFADVHSIEALLGHENYAFSSHFVRVFNSNQAIDGPLVMNNFPKNSSTSGASDKYRTESYFSRLKYNYDNRYIIEGSVRRDGSSRFHKDSRWGNFYSLGASWNISSEEFMKNVTWVDFLKLRASFGEVGNDASVDYYGWMALYDIDKNAGDPALVRNSLDASKIKWETTRTYDIGVDGRLFDRVDFSLGYFDKRSIDLLFKVQKPFSAGSYPWDWDNKNKNLTVNENIGTISNRGIELSLNVDIFKDRDFSWSIGTEATFIKNKVVKLPNGQDIIQGMRNVSEGHSIYEFYTYHFEGVDQLTGRSLYTLDPEKKDKAIKDGALSTINGVDYALDPSFAKRQWAGTALPTVYGSINTNLSYKGLSLYILSTYSLGGKLIDGGYWSLMSTASASSAGANHVDLLSKSWKEAPKGMTETSPNRIDPNGVPEINFATSNQNNGTSDRWLTSASYFTLKNINLSYNLPKLWVEKIGLNDVMLSAGVENLVIVTARQGLNPQYSYSGGYDDTFTAARVFNFGLQFKF